MKILMIVAALLAVCVPTRSQTRPVTKAPPGRRSIGQSEMRPSGKHFVDSVEPDPAISQYSPLFGLPGSTVTIRGTGFGYVQGDKYVTTLSSLDFRTFTNWPTILSWSDTKIDVRIPDDMFIGKVYLMIGDPEEVYQAWNAFTVGTPPQVLSYDPLFGPDGTSLTLYGKAFGDVRGNGSVTVWPSDHRSGRVPWQVASWSDTKIVVRVPDDLTPVKVYLYVTARNLDSIGTFPFTVGIPPTVTGFSPLYGEPGTPVTIIGSGFGQVQGSGKFFVESEVTDKSTPWAPSSWSDTQIVAAVPQNFPDGRVFLMVTAGGIDNIGTNPFTVGMPPKVETFAPLFGAPGTELTIHGSGFGPRADDSQVAVRSSVTNELIPWPSEIWTDTNITVRVPNDMPPGKVYLNVSRNGLWSLNSPPYTVGAPPNVAGYSPLSGSDGSVITIKGTGFGESQNGGHVTLISGAWTYTPLTVTSWNDTQISAQLPELTPIGLNYIYVNAHGLDCICTNPFQVTTVKP